MSLQVELKDKKDHQIIYAGKAQYQMTSNGRIYTFGSRDHTFVWKVYEDTLLIDSISQAHVHLVLRKEKKTKGWIETEFGRIDLDCMTIAYRVENERVEVQYELDMDSEKQIFHFQLKIKGADYAIH